MATDRNRVMVNLDDATFAAFHRLSAAMEKPLGTVIRNILEEVHPYFNEMAAGLEVAKKAPIEAMEKLQSALIRAQASAGQLSLEIDTARRGANAQGKSKRRASK